MADAVPVLLPVRLETRFDDQHLRVLVVPDVCWYDRTGPASDNELDLLDAAVAAAGGPVLGTPGAPASSAAAAAFDALADGVGPGRASWLARTFPASDDGTGWRVDRNAGPHVATGGPQLRITGLPPRLELHALVGGLVIRLDSHDRSGDLVVAPTGADWWPSWTEMDAAGLTFEVDLAFDPTELQALYVVGLGEADAGALVRAHRDSGTLGLLRPGAATNTVAGAPAADLGRDPAAWRALAERTVDGPELQLASALAGDPDGLGPLVGDRLRFPVRQPMVMALWGTLAAHSLREVWAAGPDAVASAQSWAIEHLEPEGPLPPLRIGAQPYGVWPVSAWRGWDSGDAPAPLATVEGQAVARAVAAIDEMAERAATGLGTVAGADDAQVWELLAQTPTSEAFDLRLCEPASMLRSTVDPGDQPRFDDWWARTLATVEAMADGRPDDGMIALGALQGLHRLGLVLPPLVTVPGATPFVRPRPDVSADEGEAMVRKEPARWVEAACRWLVDVAFRDEGRGHVDLREVEWLPASLLVRLLLVSGSVALDQAQREQLGANGPLPAGADPIWERIRKGPMLVGGGPAHRGYERFRKGVSVLADIAVDAEAGGPEVAAVFIAELERALRGLLDTATHRADPWLTGAATRRLGALAGTPRPLGLYGWVDGPFVGEPGPDQDIGVLLAPSDGQARVAVVLRDKTIDDPVGPDSRWHLDLTSRTIRDAVRLGDEVRAGAHPTEAMGREVERIVGTRTAIDALRVGFPVRTEHAGRRTCDGLAVLDAVLAGGADPRLAPAGLSVDQLGQIAALATTIDAHADLLLAEAVHHAVAGRAAAAAKALDAAAGLSEPPQLDVVSTPGRGRPVRTTVLTALAVTAPPPDDGAPVAHGVAGPGRLAGGSDRGAGRAGLDLGRPRRRRRPHRDAHRPRPDRR